MDVLVYHPKNPQLPHAGRQAFARTSGSTWEEALASSGGSGKAHKGDDVTVVCPAPFLWEPPSLSPSLQGGS